MVGVLTKGIGDLFSKAQALMFSEREKPFRGPIDQKRLPHRARTRHRSDQWPHSGEREQARRRRQIAAGSLKAENGLWIP